MLVDMAAIAAVAGAPAASIEVMPSAGQPWHALDNVRCQLVS